MRRETYYCDGCGTERKEANHWFEVISVPIGGHRKLEVFDFAARENAKQLCGQKCLLEYIDFWASRLER